MSMPVGDLRDNMVQRINKGKCPFCQESKWEISSEATNVTSSNSLMSMMNTGESKSQKLIKAECDSCGYVAYFNYNKVTK